jgi:hypothetical protein
MRHSSRVNPSKVVWKNSFNKGSGVLINFGAHILNLFFPKKEKIRAPASTVVPELKNIATAS